MPATPGFTMASDDRTAPLLLDPEASAGLAELRHGDPHGDADFRMLGGFFRVEPANAALLGDLLPALVHIRGAEGAAKRLADTIALAADEALAQRPGRDLIVERLVEVVLVEALRFCPDGFAVGRPGLLDGLADPQLARALRRLHADPAAEWTVASLAREAGLSRSTFSDRFMRKVGLAPMAYLMQWRIALAKDMLQRAPVPLETVAARIGYKSASAFSTAFRRLVGQPPSLFARVPPGSSDARQEVAHQR
jgi:AraC-like DNA-binding protein